MSRLIVLMLFFTFFHASNLKAQYNTAKLTLISGGSIPFYFNTIQRYKDGIEITNGTTLGVTITDVPSVPSSITTITGWSIEFNTYNAQTHVEGSGTNVLPLNTIQVEATNNIGLATATYHGFKDLAIIAEELMVTKEFAHLNCDWPTHQINLTYQCGKANGSLLGVTPDSYVVEIEVWLIPDF